MEKQCVVCGVTFTVRTKWSKAKRATAQWCSQKCYHASWTPERRQQIALNAKKYLDSETPEQRTARMAKVVERRVTSGRWQPSQVGRTKEQNYAWLGEDATYNAKHRWIQKHWQKTGKCENCDKIPQPFGNRKHGTEWANMSGNYARDNRNEWKELCVPCHRKLDQGKRLKENI